MTNKTAIVISRTSEWANRLRRIEFYIDGIKVGSISNGETAEFIVSPGKRSIYAKIDWCKTSPRNVMINEGDIKRYEVGCNIRGIKIFLVLYWAIFDTKNFLYLKEKA